MIKFETETTSLQSGNMVVYCKPKYFSTENIMAFFAQISRIINNGGCNF